MLRNNILVVFTTSAKLIDKKYEQTIIITYEAIGRAHVKRIVSNIKEISIQSDKLKIDKERIDVNNTFNERMILLSIIERNVVKETIINAIYRVN